MIALNIKEYCRNCREFEPKLETAINAGKHIKVVCCDHRQRCAEIERYLKKELTTQEDNKGEV